MKTLQLRYPLPLSTIFKKMKRAGYKRSKLDLMSNTDQVYFKSSKFSLVYTAQGETFIVLEETLEGKREASEFLERCNLPLKNLEETPTMDYLGFSHSLSELHHLSLHTVD